ncbi:MAG: type II secretion system protein [Planctomycetota bacterium]
MTKLSLGRASLAAHTFAARRLSKLRGFTMIELVVVISILAILSGVIVPRVQDHLKSSRDAERLASIKAIRVAIDQYALDRGSYPRAESNPDCGGWDVSHDGGFVSELREAGYLSDDLVDPINDATFHFRYFLYEKGAYGCTGESPYYVLGVRNFESFEFANQHRGFFRCPGRNWGNEFAFVAGGGASFGE